MGTDVLGYLTSKGLHTKRADKRNVNVSCFLCHEPEGKRGRLYINVDEDAEIPGLYFCHLCGAKGSLRTIKRHFGDDDDPKGYDPGIVHYDILGHAAEYYHKALNEHPEAVDYFKSRGLVRDTVVRFKLGWADGKVAPYLKSLGHEADSIREAGFLLQDGREFFNQVYTIPYYVGPTCVGVRQKEPGGKYKQPSGFVQRLFNSDAARGASEIVLTEGEFDSMIASQFGYAAMGVPGATQWQESWNEYVRDAKRVYCVFDNDSAGRSGAEKVADKVGPRCTALTVPHAPGGDDEDHNDITAWIVEQGHTQQEFTDLLKKHRETLLVTVQEAMEEWDSVQGVDGLKFGFETLDVLLSPGLLPGQVVVALAKTNTGKTLWLENTFERMAMANPEIRFLFMSLEQTRGEWFERAQRMRGFYRQDDLYPVNDNDEGYAEKIRAATRDFWTPKLLLTDKNRMTADHIRRTLDDFNDEMGCLPDVLAIDYLGYLARGFPGKDKHEKVAEAIMTLKELGKEAEIPIFTPSQSNRIGQFGQKLQIDMARDAGEIEETADFVFVLYNPDHGKHEDEGLTGKINLHIGKSRHGGKDKEVFYQFGSKTLVMVPPDDKTFYPKAIDELNFGAKEPWQHAIYRHRMGCPPPSSST